MPKRVRLNRKTEEERNEINKRVYGETWERKIRFSNRRCKRRKKKDAYYRHKIREEIKVRNRLGIKEYEKDIIFDETKNNKLHLINEIYGCHIPREDSWDRRLRYYYYLKEWEEE